MHLAGEPSLIPNYGLDDEDEPSTAMSTSTTASPGIQHLTPKAFDAHTSKADQLALCPRCCGIDFAAVASSAGKGPFPTPELLLGLPASWPVSCTLCQFFFTSLPAKFVIQKQALCYLWSTKAYFHKNEGSILPEPAERAMFIAPLNFNKRTRGLKVDCQKA